MIDLLSALRDHCDRCKGRHTTTLHFPRKVAAAAIARGETVEQAATASRTPAELIAYWAQADAEFRAQVEQSRLHQASRSIKKLRRGVRVIIGELKSGSVEGGPGA